MVLASEILTRDEAGPSCEFVDDSGMPTVCALDVYCLFSIPESALAIRVTVRTDHTPRAARVESIDGRNWYLRRNSCCKDALYRRASVRLWRLVAQRRVLYVTVEAVKP